jgi:hypothetical protein
LRIGKADPRFHRLTDLDVPCCCGVNGGCNGLDGSEVDASRSLK